MPLPLSTKPLVPDPALRVLDISLTSLLKPWAPYPGLQLRALESVRVRGSTDFSLGGQGSSGGQVARGDEKTRLGKEMEDAMKLKTHTQEQKH